MLLITGIVFIIKGNIKKNNTDSSSIYTNDREKFNHYFDFELPDEIEIINFYYDLDIDGEAVAAKTILSKSEYDEILLRMKTYTKADINDMAKGSRFVVEEDWWDFDNKSVNYYYYGFASITRKGGPKTGERSAYIINDDNGGATIYWLYAG